MACGILIPNQGLNPRAMAMKAQNPKQWTAGELLITVLLEHTFRINAWSSNIMMYHYLTNFPTVECFHAFDIDKVEMNVFAENA